MFRDGFDGRLLLCVFSVSMLFGNSLGDDVSSHFQFCSSFTMKLDFLLSWRLVATCEDSHEVGF